MRTSPALIALGSNIGDRLAHLRAAADAIDELDGVEVNQVSSLYESAPVGGPGGQDAFYNAALTVTSVLPPDELLAALHRIEHTRGRERTVHWGPRTLDLDLLDFDGQVSDDPALLLPHPRLHERRFVLVPVCDVAADWTHAGLGTSMRQLLAAIPPEPGDLARLEGDWREHDWHPPTERGEHPLS
ncbi:MAG: 2-amino-4-hydroxy-6-hydroxymethyldihydropteridine diphosphokinase [Actinomycetota bacterium]